MVLLLIILGVLFVSLLMPVLYQRFRQLTLLGLSLALLGIMGYLGTFIDPVSGGETVVQQVTWISSLDIHFFFLIDGLSLFFAFLISSFGLLILLYSHEYMEDSPQRGRFLCYLLLFLGSMLGLVLSANLISLFVFWELTSFASFLLIGFKHQQEDSRRAARQALLITAGGGLALMAGLILLEISTDSGFNLIEILTQSDAVADSGFQTAAIVLIAIGAITKSAQFPFHFWLPNAMAAPTPVSAFLHSATMVKAGVYLIFRLNPLFEGVWLWHGLLGITGALTMTWGGLKAFRADDLKKIFAYTTISALGIFFMMVGLGGKEAIDAALVYLLAHALYKGALFLTAGSIDHQTGSRRVSQLSDLMRKMPATGTAMMLSLASMAGVLPLLGFVGKESLYEALYRGENEWSLLCLGLLFLAGALFTALSIEIVYHALLKRGHLQHQSIREAGLFMTIPPLLLAAFSLLMGVVPGLTVEPLLQWSAASVHGVGPTMKLKLWHGLNLVLLLSVLTLVAGVGLYFIRQPLRRLSKPAWLSGDYLYDQALRGTQALAKWATNTLQNGYLRKYIATVVVAFSALLIIVFAEGRLWQFVSLDGLAEGLQIYELVIFAFIVLATAFLFNVRSRLVVTATFGIIGYSIALAYTLFSAPDVAITQFLAETLTLILLILILHRLPRYTIQSPRVRLKYLPFAVLFGAVMAATSFLLMNQDKDSDLQRFFLEKSISEGKGQNAVNVILVDFRALDPLGEITVLTVTMIGIMALLTFPPNPPKP